MENFKKLIRIKKVHKNIRRNMAKPDYIKDHLFDSFGLKRFRDSYLKYNENSPQDRYVSVCNTFGTNPEHSKRMYEYVSNHWLSLSTPLLAYEKSDYLSFPISCYLCYLHDNTVEGLIDTLSETNYMSTCGGGVGIKVNVRQAITHIKTYDSCVLAYKQGIRRGSYALYLDINHPEILQFIELRKSTGDYNIRSLNIHHAINISDKFMQIIENCYRTENYLDDWELIDPQTKEIVNVVSAKLIWEKIIETRLQTGEPYICFIDTCNRNMNKYQIQKGYKITQSNLCTEIIVPTNEKRSSLCTLCSINCEKYDQWKDNEKFIEDAMEFMDNVLLEFIRKADGRKYFSRVLDSAINEKNIGIGLLGFHSYLQSKNLSIEGEEAKQFNIELFRWIRHTIDKYNLVLGAKRGSPNDIKDSGKRFSYCMAIAPNATTSILMGNTSPSIEPYNSNVYRQDTVSGSGFNKNKNLVNLFKEKKFGIKLQEKIWKSIIQNNGSVQHLPNYILNESEKLIFKTFCEIDQKTLITLAADRQKYIDQGQSVTFTFHPDENVYNLHEAHYYSWKVGLKTLYYCRSMKAHKVDNLSIENISWSDCTSCQG